MGALSVRIAGFRLRHLCGFFYAQRKSVALLIQASLHLFDLNSLVSMLADFFEGCRNS